MPQAHRVYDKCSGHDCWPPRPLMSGAQTVVTNGNFQAIKGGRYAPHICGTNGHAAEVSEGSNTVIINGYSASRVGDKVSCGGTAHEGSSDVIIGD